MEPNIIENYFITEITNLVKSYLNVSILLYI